MSEPKIKIHVINNDGAGYAKDVEVVPGTSVSAFVSTNVTADASRYRIHVNANPATPNQVLQQGDRVVITPIKVAGA